MKISAIDLAKYMMMHMNKGIYNEKWIISEQSAIIMQSPLVNIGVDDQYGLAIRMRKSPDVADGKYLVGHTGSASGLYSAMFFNPEEKFGIVLISSGSLPDVYEHIFGNRKVLIDGINILYRNVIK